MTAQVDLESEPFWTKLWLKLIYGGATWAWSEQAHRSTNFIYWDQPQGEKIKVWKDRTRIADRGFGKGKAWPVAKWKKADGTLVSTDMDKGVAKYVCDIWQGSYPGEPMQMGTTKDRAITYGYLAYGVRENASVPLPAAGRYYHCGDPGWANDRHSVIVDPEDGMVHELIQFDENANSVLVNNALNWGKWKDGNLVAGNHCTATGLPIHGYMWDFTSAEAPHVQGLVLGDYVNADGTLVEGPKAGQFGYLPNTAPSYQKMVAAGGETAIRAKALNEYGFVIIDRSGYNDRTNTSPGIKSKDPSFNSQWGAARRNNNMKANFQVPVNELLLLG